MFIQKASLISMPSSSLATMSDLVISVGADRLNSSRFRSTPWTRAGWTPMGPKERWNCRVARPALRVALRCRAGWTNWRAARPALIILAGCLPAESANLSRPTPADTRAGWTPMGPKERWNWRVARPALSVALRCLAGWTNWRAAKPALIILAGCLAPDNWNLSRPTPAETRAGWTPIGPKERWNWRVARPAERVALRCLAGWTNWRAARPALIILAGCLAPDSWNLSRP